MVMSKDAPVTGAKKSAKQKLLDAALTLIRTKGYSATTVDDLCEAAGVTKGAFFHHFESKEALAIASANYWSEMTGAFFASAPYHNHADPLDRVLGYIDFRRAILQGEVPEFTCLVGTMVQEVYETSPAIREACNASISGHAAKIEADIVQAMETRGMSKEFSAESLALFTQAALQGAFILAKAKHGSKIADECVGHLRRYFEFLFQQQQSKEGNAT